MTGDFYELEDATHLIFNIRLGQRLYERTSAVDDERVVVVADRLAGRLFFFSLYYS